MPANVKSQMTTFNLVETLQFTVNAMKRSFCLRGTRVAFKFDLGLNFKINLLKGDRKSGEIFLNS